MLIHSLSPTHTTLLQLLRYALCDNAKAPKIATMPNWDEILKIAQKQGIAQIVWHGIEKLQQQGIIASEHLPTKQTRLSWAYHNSRLVNRYEQQTGVITKLAKALRNESINILILKGYGLSLCYPHPEQRACGDVDIWLIGNQELGNKLLEREFGVKVDDTKHIHTTFKLDGIMVENHFDFLNTHSHPSNRAINNTLKELVKESEAITLGDETIYIPSVKFHSLYLLRHAASHFAAVEIALRHIVDWAMFVECHHAEIDWEWLREMARRYNMERFLDVTNSLAIELCGVDCRLVPNTTHHTELARRILCDILSPEFTKRQPQGGLLKVVGFKLRRWWAHRWKQRLVYSDTLVSIFLNQLWSHILKPNNLKK